jgi:phosphatidylglycerol:prolipoprotein diacylglycerol transferase
LICCAWAISPPRRWDFFGRLANFINGELWGRATEGSVPWGVIFCNDRLRDFTGNCPAGDAPRHPSQLYEAALEGVALFAIINIATLRFDVCVALASTSASSFVLRSLPRSRNCARTGRHMPEELRGIVTMGMLLSIPMILAGAWLINRAFKQPKLAAA